MALSDLQQLGPEPESGHKIWLFPVFFCLIHYYSANNCHCLCYHDLIFLLFDYTVYLILIFSYFTNPFLALYCVIVLSVLVNSLGFSWPKQLFKLLVFCFINQLILNREGYTDIERPYYNLDNFPVAHLVAAYWVFGQVLFWVPLLKPAKIQKFVWIDFLPCIWTQRYSWYLAHLFFLSIL